MNNLKLLKHTFFSVNKNLSSVCLSNDYSDGLFCLTDNAIIFSNGRELKNVSELPYSLIKIQCGSSLYCSTVNSILSFDNFTGEQIDSVEFANEIIDFSLSPDQSILIVLTDDLQITVVSNDLEIITSYPLEQTGFGTAESISIGWGKKETQFHGKIGKDARAPIEKLCEISKHDLQNVSIAWKEDGEYFVISWISFPNDQKQTATGVRSVRIFSRDGELFSTFEPINVLENGLFWRSRYNMIVTSCRSNKGLEIVFCEQNGLRHGGFVLFDVDNCNDKYVSQVSFNHNDDICSVVVRDLSTNSTHVNLFTTNNYHWYLKRTLTIDGLDNISLHWSTERLHVCNLSTGTHDIYEWYFETDRSVIGSLESCDTNVKAPSLVAVINGDRISMTPFEHCVIPPPYCAFTIDFSPGDSVAFVSLPMFDRLSDNDRLSCLVQLGDTRCYWLELVSPKASSDPTDDRQTLSTTLQFGKPQCLYRPIVAAFIKNLDGLINSVTWRDNDSFYCVLNNQLLLFQLRRDRAEVIIEELSIGDISVAKVTIGSEMHVQDTSGQVYIIDRGSLKVTPVFKYSSFCSEMYSIRIQSETSDIIVSLSTRFNQLYINDRLQSGAYISILPMKLYLIVTAVNQQLRCIRLIDLFSLKDLIDLLDSNSNRKDFDFDHTTRLIEPGTQIVTCVPVDSKIVLMMPRGNLEAIYPRALVLDDLQRLMNADRYIEALEKMRRQRVNLNLLFDHDRSRFMANLESLVTRYHSSDRLMIFMADLSQEDVTETMYKRFYTQSRRNCTPLSIRTLSVPNKINQVCSSVAKMLESNVTKDSLKSLLSCYVKMIPSATDKALQLLCTFKESGNLEFWDDGLKHLQYLTTIDELYRVALSTYDLNLTLQVAQKTQLDPKEYVSFINDLSELPCQYYRQYKINIFLKKPILALESLAKVADSHWDETIELITKHKLYVEALDQFSHGSSLYNAISARFAEHLIQSGDLKAAGMVYLRTGDSELCELAADVFIKGLHWKEWIIASKKFSMDKSEVDKSLSVLCDRLKNASRYSEAVYIYEFYLNDSPRALKTALDGRLFTDAFRIMASIDNKDYSSLINESILKSSNDISIQLEDYESSFRNGFERLGEIRQSFVDQYREMRLTGEDEVLPDYMSDTTSDASSVFSQSSSTNSKISNFSNISNRSTKMKIKKKKSKKEWSDKKGSQKEEVGVLENLYKNVGLTQALIEDIRGLVEMLCFIGSVKESRLLIEGINRLLSLQSGAISSIWDEFLVGKNNQLNEFEFQISNHITVSRSDQYLGRRRYLLDEEFLNNAPRMTVTRIMYSISETH